MCSSESPKSKIFDYQSICVSDAPAGTIISLQGSVQHAGSGIKADRVRSILFWTYGNTKYSGDTQYTKLTIGVTLVQELWKNKTVRLELLKLLYYCFVTTDTSFQRTCVGCFLEYRRVSQFFTDLNDINKNDVQSVLTVLHRYCDDDQLFFPPEKVNHRQKRAEKRSSRKNQIDYI